MSLRRNNNNNNKKKKAMIQPIDQIFHFLQNKQRVEIHLFEDKNIKIEGEIIGFDEYMNLVLDNCIETDKNNKRNIGRIMLKGDNIVMIKEIEN